MPIVQVLNVHKQEERPLSRAWRSGLEAKITAMVSRHLTIPKRTVVVTTPSTPACGINDTVVCYVDLLPDETRLSTLLFTESAMVFIQDLGELLEQEVYKIRLALKSSDERVRRPNVIIRTIKTTSLSYITSLEDKIEVLASQLPLGDCLRDRQIAEFVDQHGITCIRDWLPLRYMALMKDLETNCLNHVNVLLAYHGLRLGMSEDEIDTWLEE